MNEDYKLVAIMLFLAIGLPMIGMLYSDYNKTRVIEACYEASKTNHTLVCEAKK